MTAKPGNPPVRKAAPPLRQRKRAARLNVFASLLLAAVLVAMVNYLAARYYLRHDLSANPAFRLSPATLELLGDLAQPVEAVVLFPRTHEQFENIERLLREYRAKNPLLQTTIVDPDRDPARAEQLVRELSLDRVDVVAFRAGDQTRVVESSDIFALDPPRAPGSGAPRALRFSGEQAFSSALYSLTRGSDPVVYFLQGHGERSVEDFAKYTGYAEMARRLRRSNLDVRSLVLGREPAIPADCALLVVAGPVRRIPQPEVDLIRTYLDRNGRLLALLDAHVDSGLEALLERWGVLLGPDVVVDATRTLSGRELFVTGYASHPITDRLGKLSSVFYFPRSVRIADSAASAPADPDKPRLHVLAACSDSGWAEMSPEENPMTFTPGVDIPGPVPIAVAVERGLVPGLDVQIAPSRMVVIGDADFAANGASTGGNVDFLLAAVNWLVDRETFPGVESKTLEELRIKLSAAELRMLFAAVAGGIPGLAALWGVIVWMVRRI